jgi:hypothetical protein
MVPVAPFISGIAFAFTFNIHYIYVVRSLCFWIFSDSFFIAFLSSDFFLFRSFLFFVGVEVIVALDHTHTHTHTRSA